VSGWEHQPTWLVIADNPTAGPARLNISPIVGARQKRTEELITFTGPADGARGSSAATTTTTTGTGPATNDEWALVEEIVQDLRTISFDHIDLSDDDSDS
jgi:hypothetical protein